MRSGKPILLKAGLPPEVYELIESYSDLEIESGYPPQFTHLETVVATRRNVVLPELTFDDEEKPILPDRY